jgi:ornithine cyclodeaminase/alanine dehydrogenase-like protein (mu-crystallin family)
MLLLTESDVRALLPMTDLIETMHIALAELSAGRVQQPLRTVLEIGPQHAFFGVMPAFIPKSGALGTKLVTVFGSNIAQGLPSHLATILLLDSTTGALLSVMDGRYITEARTAAVSAVSVKLLAHPDASRLAILGAGVQARSHLRAIACVRGLKEVRVWSPSGRSRTLFVEEMQSETTATLTAVDDARAAVADADVIVLATASREPVVQSAWIADGAHIAAVGACRPDQREMDTALVARARVFVDSRRGALAEAGDLVIPIAEGAFDATHIAGELGELAGAAVAARTTHREITVFKSLGMAVEDVAAAHLVYQRAMERGLGQPVRL